MEPIKKTDPFKKKQLNDFGRFAGLGLQMMGTILALCALGNWADKKLLFHFPLFTLVGAVVGITASLFWLFKSTSNK